jgi:hypothetical protein
MIKRTLAVIALVSVLILLAVPPVLADNSKKIPVTFTRSGGYASVGEHWYVDDTFHLRGTIVGFNVYRITGQGISYSGNSEGTMWTNLHNVHTVVVSSITTTVGYGQATTDSQIVFGEHGTFEGVIQMKGLFKISTAASTEGYTTLLNGEFRGIWHGTGEYTGQTLILEYTPTNGIPPSPLVGTLLIP